MPVGIRKLGEYSLFTRLHGREHFPRCVVDLVDKSRRVEDNPPYRGVNIMELTEKILQSMGGWAVFKEARAIHAAGRVIEASYDPPVLKGRLAEGGRQFFAGLKLRNAIDVENLCPCRDSRVRGIICAHSVAVGLQALNPVVPRTGVQTEPARAERRDVRETTDEKPAVELKLEGSLRHLEAEISFRYARPGLSNPEAEAEALARLAGCGFREERGRAVIKGEDATIRFFAGALPALRREWKVVEGERFRNVTRDFVRIEPQFAIRETGDGWLDFRVHFTAGKEAVFSHSDIQRMLRSGQKHVRLKDGRIAVADGGMVEDLEEVLRDCNPRQERGGFRISTACAGYLGASVGMWKGQERDAAATNASPDALGDFVKLLRAYQTDGALWLLDRARAGTGGLLADEMGLGKTVQTLAMLRTVGGTSLVVCPSSLVWNWRAEAERFCPSMRVLTVDGADREERFARIAEHDLIVTSYALLRRDVERYKTLAFSTVVLDEAQHIKNPDSQNAKAACAIRARSRFILTGTPLENSVRDLWSLFEFLLPGYLGARSDFKERYETLLASSANGVVWERLGRRIRSFILRRRKADVLTELPEKMEQYLFVELTRNQKQVYDELQRAARERIDELGTGEGSGAARMQVLTALLRLRQACCDLRLLGAPNASEEESSAKVGALLELIDEARDGSHRVLLFSQFTGMLDLVEEAFQRQNVTFARLDGGTRDREAVVRRFREDAGISVFLISLKAGGVGLNLTEADTVIHYDPWWNPAVEAQASDRAHRIGQKQVVNVIKLIARDTIEERVVRMQEKKRALLAGVLDGEAGGERWSAETLRELVE
jgi:superfamily II DNA or RNA helicase